MWTSEVRKEKERRNRGSKEGSGVQEGGPENEVNWNSAVSVLTS